MEISKSSIYTTFILGPLILNFGEWAHNFGSGRLVFWLVNGKFSLYYVLAEKLWGPRTSDWII